MKKTARFCVRTALALLLLAGLVGVGPRPAVHAFDQTVTNTHDAGPGSLRQAIVDVNPGGSITFDLDAYPATITLLTGELTINKSMVITGPGVDQLTISGDDKSGVLNVAGGKVIISALTIANGLVTGFQARGGGIFNHGNLVMAQAVITTSKAQSQGGLLNDEAAGGGIYNDNLLTLQSCTVSNNVAAGGDSSAALPSGSGGRGGGIYNTGTLTVTDVVLEDNTAQGGAGVNPGDDGSLGGGGALFNGEGSVATVASSIVSHNQALGGDGLRNGGSGEGGAILNEGTLTILGSALEDNLAQGGHGEVGMGGSAQGGGLKGEFATAIRDSSLSGNSAQAGDSTSSSGGDASGGGVADWHGLYIRRSTLRNNTVLGGDGLSTTDGRSYGGGLYIAGSNLDTQLVNSTFSSNEAQAWANSAPSVGLGGGLFVRANAVVRISFCTIADNAADDRGGGLMSDTAVDNTGPRIKNTIIADNTAPTGPDIYQRVQSRGYNLIGDTTDGILDEIGGGNIPTGNRTNEDALLGPLRDNGGLPTPTAEAPWTHALRAGSPAIDGGNPTDILGFTVKVDGRSFDRPYPLPGEHDMGAFERSAANLEVDKEASPSEVEPGGTVTYTLTLTNTGQEVALDVVLSDVLPISLTVTAVVNEGLAITDTGASPPYVWQVGDLRSYQVGSLTLTAVLSTGLPAGLVLGNTAVLTTTTPDLDPADNESQAEVTVLNVPPVAAGETYTVSPGSVLGVPVPGVLANDTDLNGDALSAIEVTGPTSGTLALEADGSFAYTPTAGFVGVDAFTYIAHDGAADSNPATVTLTVETLVVYVHLPLVLRDQ
jgi:uncharacterized repeat protein (TIGR01451 family)